MTHPSSHARLRRLFRALVSVSAASAAATAGAGCAGGVSPAGFTTDLCGGDAGMYSPMRGVTATVPVDYIALRTQQAPYPGQPPAMDMPVTVSSEGTACATATDAAACNAALAALRSDNGWPLAGNAGPDSPQVRYVVYTRGNEVGMVTTLGDLATFIGPIDTAADAALLATERGYRVDCSRGPHARQTATGWDLRVQSGYACGAGTGIDEHRVAVTSGGSVTVAETVRIRDGEPNCAIGRRPEGFALRGERRVQGSGGGDARASLGAYFAQAAELEAASVFAFERLARELRAHGAPASLVEAAERAARDEVRHARVTARLAARFGGTPRAVECGAMAVRDALAVALENAAEGCVRETFGALQATHQAARASDPGIARAMRAIAADETRHAALAWDVAAWLEPRLADDERARVDAARCAARDALAHDLAHEPAPGAVALAGAPTARAALAMHAAVAPELWAA